MGKKTCAAPEAKYFPHLLTGELMFQAKTLIIHRTELTFDLCRVELQGYKTVEQQVIMEVKVNVSSFRREVIKSQSIRLNL